MYAAPPDLYVYTSQPLEGVRWVMYDALGREVHRQAVGWLSAGHHRWALPAGLPAGGYDVVRLESVTGVGRTLRYWQGLLDRAVVAASNLASGGGRCLHASSQGRGTRILSNL
ncbi:MAG: hypothetical protein KatS3mg026_1348 [Bacteroidia bacterium]|nr:MAG: hypothetical protein KatS3mg026_1348 [Bacteroidia bacterium]